MPSRANDDQQETPIKAASPEDYAAFIGQIQLRQIWLVRATIQNNVGPVPPMDCILRVEGDPTWRQIDGGFRAESHYEVHILSPADDPIADIAVTFAVDFDSPAPMTDSLFAHFGLINLPINTWPYLREFISTTFGRMNWPPYALPALKRGTLPTNASTSSKKANRASRRADTTGAGSRAEDTMGSQEKTGASSKRRTGRVTKGPIEA